MDSLYIGKHYLSGWYNFPIPQAWELYVVEHLLLACKFAIRLPPYGKQNNPDIMVHGTSMGPIWGRQNPGGPHVGPINFAILEHSDHILHT